MNEDERDDAYADGYADGQSDKETTMERKIEELRDNFICLLKGIRDAVDNVEQEI